MRGGLRVKTKYKNGDQALLAAIFAQHGGPSEVARKVSLYAQEPIIAQAPVNWRSRGRVPHKLVRVVAEALGINPAGLNYGILADLSEDIPTWTEVVKSYGLPKPVVDHILFLKVPNARR